MKTIKNILIVGVIMYFTLGSSVLLNTVNAVSSTSSTSSVSSSKSTSSRAVVVSAFSRSSESSESEDSRTSSSRSSIGSIEDTIKGTNTALNAYKTAKTADKITALIKFADNAIDERISFLTNTLLVRVNSETDISAANKTKLINMINDEIAALQAEKTTIDGTTDLTTLKTEVRSIYEAQRIYVTFGPKIYGLIATYRLEFLEAKLDIVLARVETTIQNNKDTLTNYTAINSYLTSAQAELAAAKAATTLAELKFSTMLPAKDTTPSKGLRDEGRNQLAIAKQSLIKVRNYLKQISLLINQTSSSSSSSESSENTTTNNSVPD